MAVKVVFHPDTRIIQVNSGVTELDVKRDLYSDAKEDWLSDATLNKLEFPFIPIGGNDIGSGQVAPTYFFLKYPWVVKTPGDGTTLFVALNLYGLAENGVDNRNPFTVTPGDGLNSTNSNIPGLDSEMNAAIQHASFNEGVTVDVTSSNTGTLYPVGNTKSPVNNIPDARLIAAERGFKTIYIRGNITLTTGDDISSMKLIGENASRSAITIETGAITDNSEINEAFVTGILDSGIIIRNCIIQDLEYVDGVVFNSMINPGTITLGNNATGHFLDCFSGVPGTSTPIIDCGGSGQALAMRNYNGGIQLTNKTGSDSVSIDLNSGQVKLDPDPVTGVTNGTLVIRGGGKAIRSDNSEFIPVGTSTFNSATVINELLNPVAVTEAVWDEPLADHTAVGTTGKVLALTEFGEQVHIDTTSGITGTDFPNGTPAYPVNNLTDALIIANSLSIKRMHITGSLTLSGSEDVSGFTFVADRSLGNTLTITNATTAGTFFENLTVSGTLNGQTRFTTCVLGALTGFDGGAKNSLITDTIEVVGAGANYFTDCDTYTNATGSSVEIDIGTSSVNMIRCRGYYSISEKTSTDATTIDLVAGEITVTSTCTAGAVVIAGIADVTDNSTGSCTVLNNALSRDALGGSAWDELLSNHTIADSFGKVVADIAINVDDSVALSASK